MANADQKGSPALGQAIQDLAHPSRTARSSSRRVHRRPYPRLPSTLTGNSRFKTIRAAIRAPLIGSSKRSLEYVVKLGSESHPSAVDLTSRTISSHRAPLSRSPWNNRAIRPVNWSLFPSVPFRGFAAWLEQVVGNFGSRTHRLATHPARNRWERPRPPGRTTRSALRLACPWSAQWRSSGLGTGRAPSACPASTMGSR